MKHKLSRRDFLKITASTSLLSSTLTFNDVIVTTINNENVKTNTVQNTETRFSACLICGQACPLRIDIVPNNKLAPMIVRHNTVSELDQWFAACGKPRLLFEMWNHPDRIKGPLIREGNKGDGKFRSATWDEALNYVAENLKKYIDKPEQIVVFAHQGYEAGFIKAFFKGIIGTPNTTAHDDTCYLGNAQGKRSLFGKPIGPGGLYSDYAHAQLIILMGRDPINGLVATPWTKALSVGKSHGAKIIVFDVKRPRIADLADEFILVAPGTDLAIVLAFMNVIINESLYNSSFLISYTNAPMLIYTDTMEPVKLTDHPKYSGKKTYLVYDSYDGKYKLKTDAYNPQLEYSGEYNGRPVKTVFTLLKESINKYTPKWAEEISSVPEEEIRRIARLLAAYAPRAFIDHGYKGSRYRNESMFYRVAGIVNALIGSYGAKGGIAWPKNISIPSPLSIMNIKTITPSTKSIAEYWSEEYPLVVDDMTSMLFIKSILEEKPYPVKVAIIYNQNLISHIQGSSKVEEALKKLEFTVIFDVMWNETAPFADVILPIPFFFEYNPITLVQASKANIAQIILPMKVIDPPSDIDVKTPGWITYELIKRLKPEIANSFKIFAENPESIQRKQAEKLNINFDELKTKGVTAIYNEPLYKVPIPFATVTGEIELINVSMLAKFKDQLNKPSLVNPLPCWVPPYYMEDGKINDDEFVAIDTTYSLTAYSYIRNSKLINDTIKWEKMNGVYINFDRGVRLGLKDGDNIIIENLETGVKIRAKVFLSHEIHPYVIVGIHGLNSGSYERGNIKFTYMTKTGINTNFLAPFKIVEYEARAAQCDFKVKVRKEVIS
ncbi:MAG: molybdopterin-containing oxidoreductase family protein [Thermoprotei archaeon]